jgi:hypothetical protein
MKQLILVLSSLYAASRECHGFGISIRPMIARLPLLSRGSSLDDYHGDLNVLRAEIEEMGGDPSFLPDQRDPLLRICRIESSTEEEVFVQTGPLRTPPTFSSFVGSLNTVHPLISMALERQEDLSKEDNNQHIDSAEVLEALRAEIESIGGDPSFLPSPERELWTNNKNEDRLKVERDEDDNEQIDSAADLETLRAEVKEMGGDPSFLPSSPMQALINDTQEDWLKVRGTDEDESAAEDLESQRADIEAMGGDPWFLSGPEREPSIKSKQDERVRVEGADNYNEENDSSAADVEAEIEAMGGDPWFLPSRQRKPSIKSKQDELLKVGGGDGHNQKDDSAADIEAMGGDPWFLPSAHKVPSIMSSQDELKQAAEDDGYNQQDESAAEIEAMGGDPWFLPSPQKEPSIKSKQDELLNVGEDDGYNQHDESAEEIDAMGGDSWFLPSPQHEPLINRDENHDAQNDSLADLEVLRAKIDAMGGDSSFVLSQQMDPTINKLMKGKKRLSEEEELLEIGGDPAFLGNYNEQQNDPNGDLDLLRAEIEEMGGDPSFL